MNLLIIVALSIAGGLGAVARLVLDGFVRSRVKTVFPLGTTLINVTGSLLLGFVIGLAVTHALSTEWGLILGVGFLGGYTTFSTASFETVRLAQTGQYMAALGNGLGMFALALLAAGGGVWLGSLPW